MKAFKQVLPGAWECLPVNSQQSHGEPVMTWALLTLASGHVCPGWYSLCVCSAICTYNYTFVYQQKKKQYNE